MKFRPRSQQQPFSLSCLLGLQKQANDEISLMISMNNLKRKVGAKNTGAP